MVQYFPRVSVHHQIGFGDSGHVVTDRVALWCHNHLSASFNIRGILSPRYMNLTEGVLAKKQTPPPHEKKLLYLYVLNWADL
jgi:hypothetical protein